MPAKTDVLYLLDKFKHERRIESYIADMLWSINGGITGKLVLPEYPRYNELNKTKSAKPTQKDYTEQDIINMFLGA